MKKIIKQLRVLLPLSLLVLFSSCLGLNLDISLNANGSGTVTVEYQVSRYLDSLGRLDGNERWNTIPVGRADFERTLDRLPGMRLLSFSSREDERDVVFNARMEFETIQTLLSFLDAFGERSSFSGDASSGHLELILSDGRENNNTAIDRLVTEVFRPYSVNINMTFPNGRSKAFSFPTHEVLTSSERIVIEFDW